MRSRKGTVWHLDTSLRPPQTPKPPLIVSATLCQLSYSHGCATVAAGALALQVWIVRRRGMGNTDRQCLRRKRWHAMLVRGVCACVSVRCGELGAVQCRAVRCSVETEGRGIRLMEHLGRRRGVLCLGAGVLSPICTPA